jgi:alpha-L-fucosidase
VTDLIDLFFSSVGRNSKLLLNVPPTPAGLLHSTDIARLAGMHEELTGLFRDDLAAAARTTWRRTGLRSAEAEVNLGRRVSVGIARLEERIAVGQVVERYTILGQDEAGWRELSRGTTIGYARLDRFAPSSVRRVRVVIEDSIRPPEPIVIRLYAVNA